MTQTTTHGYTLTRDLPAPVDAVWQAWTVADNYGQWASAEDVTLDVRPGGHWSSVMVIPGGARIPLSGCYCEVVQNKRLVIGMPNPGQDKPARMTLDLASDGDHTRITVSQELDSVEARDQAEAGTTMLLDSLTTFLAAA